MRFHRLRRMGVRLTLGALAFALAALTLIWPIRFQAATGASWHGDTGHYTLSDFVTRSCSWELRLGHVPTDALVLPRTGNMSFELLDNYNQQACTAKRYDRTSQALLWVIFGSVLTISGLRRRTALAARQIPGLTGGRSAAAN